MNRYFISFAISICILSSYAIASTIYIPADYPTIQAGINAAYNGDTVLVADGVYNEHVDFSGKLIVVMSENGYSNAIINGVNPNMPVVLFESQESQLSILQGFTIKNSIDAPGIGIFNSNPVIINNLISDNSGDPSLSGEGGGVYCFNFAGLIRGNIISNNLAGSGGGISIWNSNSAVFD